MLSRGMKSRIMAASRDRKRASDLMITLPSAVLCTDFILSLDGFLIVTS